MSKKVFLGGTCNGSTWRDDLIPQLKIRFFNPVVEGEWRPEHLEEELRQRQECDYCLYTITPRMTGVYSIAEVVDDSNKRPEKTLFCVLRTDGDRHFELFQLKSLRAVANLLKLNGVQIFETLEDVADFLNDEGEADD